MELVKLKSVAEVFTGYPFKSNSYGNTGIRVIRGENITEGRLRWDSIKCWDQPFDKKNHYSLRENDIVIGMDGSKVGKNKARVFKFDLPLLLAQRVACVRANQLNDQVFLFYCIHNPRFEDYVYRIQTGSSVPHISKTQIEEFVIPLIEISEQKKITKVLSDIDAKIVLNNKINDELESMAKLIYDYWFVQFDFPDENGKPYKSSGGKMVYNEELKREIPDGWVLEHLEQLIDVYDSERIPLSKSEREKRKGTYPYFGATGILDYVDDFIFDGEYILLAEDGSVMNEEGNPIVQFIWGKTWVNNHAHVIRAKKEELNEYIFQALSRIPVVLIKSGSIQMKINQRNLLGFSIVKPPEHLMSKYSDNVKAFRKMMMKNIDENQQLAELRDWLLPMLMNGQVTIKD